MPNGQFPDKRVVTSAQTPEEDETRLELQLFPDTCERIAYQKFFIDKKLDQLRHLTAPALEWQKVFKLNINLGKIKS